MKVPKSLMVGDLLQTPLGELTILTVLPCTPIAVMSRHRDLVVPTW